MTDPKLPQLAEGSEWLIDPEDGSFFIADTAHHLPVRIEVSAWEPRSIVLTHNEEEAASATVANVLAISRRAGLDTEYDALRLAAKNLMLAFDEFTRETHDCSECEEADYVGEHVRIDDVIDHVRKLEALL